MRELDDGGAGDDGGAEGFGEGEFQAWGVGYVDVENERFVAVRAEEGEAEVVDWGGEGARYGLESGTEGVHGERKKCVL